MRPFFRSFNLPWYRVPSVELVELALAAMMLSQTPPRSTLLRNEPGKSRSCEGGIGDDTRKHEQNGQAMRPARSVRGLKL